MAGRWPTRRQPHVGSEALLDRAGGTAHSMSTRTRSDLPNSRVGRCTWEGTRIVSRIRARPQSIVWCWWCGRGWRGKTARGRTFRRRTGTASMVLATAVGTKTLQTATMRTGRRQKLLLLLLLLLAIVVRMPLQPTSTPAAILRPSSRLQCARKLVLVPTHPALPLNHEKRQKYDQQEEEIQREAKCDGGMASSRARTHDRLKPPLLQVQSPLCSPKFPPQKKSK